MKFPYNLLPPLLLLSSSSVVLLARGADPVADESPPAGDALWELYCSDRMTVPQEDALVAYFGSVPYRNVLVDPATARASNSLFELKGRVFGDDCTTPIAGATVEIWYAGTPDANGVTYRMEYRGKMLTNDCGQYSFSQTFPVDANGNPNVHMIVSAPTGVERQHEVLATKVYLQEGDDQSLGRQGLDPTIIAPVVTSESDGTRYAEFNVYLKTPGTGIADLSACKEQDREDNDSSETLIDFGDTTPADPQEEEEEAQTTPTTPAPQTTAPGPVVTPAPTPPPVTQSPTPAPVPQNFVSGNNDCSSASTALPVTVMGGNQPMEKPTATVRGDTVNGQLFSASSCFGVSSSGPSNWFRFTGTGGIMIASTCHPGTTLDTKITVYQGNSCGSLQCVTANDDMGGTGTTYIGAGGTISTTASRTSEDVCSYNHLASQVEWDSQQGATYYLQIHSIHKSRTGPYEVSVESYLKNDQCSQATPLGVGETYTRSTVGAAIPYEGNMARCQNNGGTVGYNRGMWYSVVGTGRTMEASTCGSAIANKVYLFQDTCEDRPEFRYPGPPGPKRRLAPGTTPTFPPAILEQQQFNGNRKVAVPDEEEDEEESNNRSSGHSSNKNKSYVRGSRNNRQRQPQRQRQEKKKRELKYVNGVWVDIHPPPVDFITHCIGGVHNANGKPNSCNALQWTTVAGRQYYILATSTIHEGDITMSLREV